MSEAYQLALIAGAPLAGFILLGLFGKSVFGKFSGMLATAFMLISFIAAVLLAYRYFFVFGNSGDVYHSIYIGRLEWLRFSPGLSIDLGCIIDPLSTMMLLVITLVSLMVHLYSTAYMKGEKRMPAYFAFLNLFSFSMLGLVLSANIFQIYIFWELVGLSSYLLIGFYYEKPTAVAASKKAFIVTRFADLGFLIGILILSFYGRSLDFATLLERLTTTGSPELSSATASGFLGISAISWGAFLVFIGGAGKSALLPLHIWLPDAMEGPTPVSALIHAATMVVAGVYLIARLFPLFVLSTPEVFTLISYIGAITALVAAIIACTQTDIKRVLAYSTMSQIGYMIFALAVSGYGAEKDLGYTASLFHLFTHAMFKALLFLAAGVIIHVVHSNDMKSMGGLRKILPITHLAFLAGCLAIAGIPPFAGFFSKEEILLAAYDANPIIYFIGLLASGLTAFYMFRLYFSVFWNKDHATTGKDQAHGESSLSWAMKFPLLVLATGALLAGFIPFGHFVSSDGRALDLLFHPAFSVAPVAIALAGLLLAASLYRKASERPNLWASRLGGFYRIAKDKFYFDELYLFVTQKIIFNILGKPAAWIDRNIVDGVIRGTGNLTYSVSVAIKKFQSGNVQQYAIVFLSAAIALGFLFIYVWI